MSNLYPLLKNDRFEFLEHDLTNDIPLKVDYIYHLAGCGDYSNYFDNKYDFILNSFENLKNIIKFTQNNGARLIFITQHLDYQETNIELFEYFDYLKLAQTLIETLIKENKLNCSIARLDYTYGENLSREDGRFITQNIIKAFKNEDIIIDYDEKFYFTCVQDVIENLITLMTKGTNEVTVDIFNQNLYLKSDLIKLIIKYAKSDSKFIRNFEITNSPNYKNTNPNEYKCETNVLDGILNTVKWFKLMYFS